MLLSVVVVVAAATAVVVDVVVVVVAKMYVLFMNVAEVSSYGTGPILQTCI